MSKPENKHVAAILIAYENTVQLCVDWCDSVAFTLSVKRCLSDIISCNSNLVVLMTGKAEQPGWLLSNF